MSESFVQAKSFVVHSEPRIALYPLQRRFITYGILAAFIGGALFWSLLTGFTFFVLFTIAGFLWRRDEPPILAYGLGFQWLAVVMGYFYYLATGDYPGLLAVGDLDGAVFLSMVGLLILAIGVRLGWQTLERYVPSASARRKRSPRYNIRRLFWLVIALSTVNWWVEIYPMAVWFTGAQILSNVLRFRSVLYFLLLFAILQQREGYRYGLIAFIYTWIPSFASMMSASIGAFFPLFLVLVSEWRPWSDSLSDRRRGTWIMAMAVGIAATIFLMGLLWQGGIKQTWRQMLWASAVEGTPVAKAQAFISTALRVTPEIEFRPAFASLVSRMSSGVGYFSHVLWRVPELIPHERGRLTLRAIKHVVMPRILFPNKPNLGSDSWLIWQYAGLPVAGAEQKTSVGLGYIPEFYIDFGVPVMFVPLVIYGFIIGLVYQVLRYVSPSYNFSRSAVAVAIGGHVATYDSEIAKLLGGLLMTFIVLSVLLRVLGPWLHNVLVLHRPTLTKELRWSVGPTP